MTIHGYLFNTGTGNAFPDIEVQFLEAREHMFGDSETKIWKTITDENGNFSFSDITINYDDKYSYGFYVETKGDLNSYYINGIGSFEINKNAIDINHIIGISATFKNGIFYLQENTQINLPDSFTLVLE
ncbi:MAG: hypothetical protein HY738_02105, partial [Bacteroidia bacterium]|nr:hypothetical protein [Bacteroidia bacterium]